MDQRQHVRTKYIDEPIRKIHKEIFKAYEGKEVLFTVNGTETTLSKAQAEFGLMLYNCYSNYRENPEAQYNYYDTVVFDSKRHKAFLKRYGTDIFTDKITPVLWYIFGDEVAPLIIKVWDKIGDFMYQDGIYRRSFRNPNNDEINYVSKLNFLIGLANQFPQYDLTIAERLQHDNIIQYHNGELSLLLIALDDDKWNTLFLDVLYNRHPEIKVSRTFILAALMSPNENYWKAVGDVLLAAQRQEGLRQIILSCADEGNIGAFKYLIKQVIDHKLSRFSSVLQAVETWVGLGWEAEKETTIRRFLELGYRYLNNEDERTKAVLSKDNAEVYMALWAQGTIDINEVAPLLEKVWEQNSIEKKCLALLFVQSANIRTLSYQFGLLAIQSDNLTILAFGHPVLRAATIVGDENTYKRLEELLEVVPKKETKVLAKVFAWTQQSIAKKNIYQLMLNTIKNNTEQDQAKLLPYFSELEVYQREELTRIILKDYFLYSWNNAEIKNKKPLTGFQKNFALTAVKDRSTTVMTTGMEALKNATLAEDEIVLFENMLSRKAAGLRQSVIDLLQKNDATILGSIKRLLQAKNIEQRLAALDISIQLQKKNKFKPEISALVTDFKNNRKCSNREEILVDNILSNEPEYNIENGYGLYDPSIKTLIPEPKMPEKGAFVDHRPDLFMKSKGFFKKKNKITYGLSKPISEIEKDLQALFKLYEENGNHEYTYFAYKENHTILLINYFTYKSRDKKLTERALFEQLPLYEIWEKWFVASKLTNFDLFTLQILINDNDNQYFSPYVKEGYPESRKQLANLLPTEMVFPNNEGGKSINFIKQLVDALLRIYPFKQETAYRLGAMSYIAVMANKEELIQIVTSKKNNYGRKFNFFNIKEVSLLWLGYGVKNDSLFKEYFELTRWRFHLQEQVNTKNIGLGYHISTYDYAKAFDLKLITKDELTKKLFTSLQELTAPIKDKQNHILKELPFLKDFLNPIRNRVLEVELKRGDKPTALTSQAQNIQQLFGQNYFFKIVKALGNSTLNKGYVYHYGGSLYTKKEMLSTLLKRCLVVSEEAQEEFNKAATALNLPEKRWVEIALYSQQWATNIKQFLGWEDMESAVWWLHAHTNAYHSKETESEIATLSSMPLTEFKRGGVDVDWFYSAYEKIGKARWKILYNAAKYITDGIGYNRAKLYADVLLGDKKIREITTRVKDKRNQDYLRVYGLVPLSKKTPEKDILSRYLFIQNFIKESKQFGAQRQESEKTAAEVALDNLARTAGYPDPMRLTWAMEAKQAQEILKNAQDLTFDGTVTISLEIDDNGKPSLSSKRGDKLLKNIPAKYKKDKQLIALKSYVKQLREQHSRTRKSLENAMVQQDAFLWKEITSLFEHPVVHPLLKNLVFKFENTLGFPTENGLTNHLGETFSLKADDEVVLAHAYDFYQAKQWESYQTHSFTNSIKQPFKQIFRELYVPTPDELHKKSVSNRYEGHQVQPSKTLALLKARNWRVSYEEGLQKVYHKQGVIAKIYAMADWFTPAEIEAPTLETIQFYTLKDHKPIAFTDLSAVIFSEVMRDLDLVVSVAHVGDVDPETSQSTVEMRSVLVTEMARLFKLDNIKVEGRHVHITGSMANYSIHLGSAVVFQKPGKQLGVIPIHSQHRGRIFLPFADDDPKSAELMSKVLLFAKDNEIQDPSILSQLNLVIKK